MQFSVVGKFRFESSEVCCLCSKFIGAGRFFVRTESKIAHYKCAKKRGWKKKPREKLKTQEMNTKTAARKIRIIRNGSVVK